MKKQNKMEKNNHMMMNRINNIKIIMIGNDTNRWIKEIKMLTVDVYFGKKLSEYSKRCTKKRKKTRIRKRKKCYGGISYFQGKKEKTYGY